MGQGGYELDRVIPLVVAAPSAGLVGFWAVVAVGDRFPDTPQSFQLFDLTMLVGALASLFGPAYCTLGACLLGPRHRPRWLAGLAVCGAGLTTDFVGFVLYLGTGC